MLFINKSEKFCTNHFLKRLASGSFVSSEVENGCGEDALKCRDGSSGRILVRCTCRRGHYVHNFDKAFAAQLCQHIYGENLWTRKWNPSALFVWKLQLRHKKDILIVFRGTCHYLSFPDPAAVLGSLISY